MDTYHFFYGISNNKFNVTNLVYTKCFKNIKLSNINLLNDSYSNNNNLLIINDQYKYTDNDKVDLYIDEIKSAIYGSFPNYINVNINKYISDIFIPQNKNEIFTDVLPNVNKFFYIVDQFGKEHIYLEDSIITIHQNKIILCNSILQKCNKFYHENKFGFPLEYIDRCLHIHNFHHFDLNYLLYHALLYKKNFFTYEPHKEDDLKYLIGHFPKQTSSIEIDLCIFDSKTSFHLHCLSGKTLIFPTFCIIFDIIDKNMIDNTDWVLYDTRENISILKKIILYKKFLFPISFCIPHEKISYIPLENKTKLLANIIPMRGTYLYSNENDYYNDYQTSFFAITHRRNGWDSLRHYEILMNSCIPYFVDLFLYPDNILSLYPKSLIYDSNKLYETIKDFELSDFLSSPYFIQYQYLLQSLQDYTSLHLTSTSMAKYLLNKSNHSNVNKILFISYYTHPDYLRCLLLHGLKSIYGKNCHDFPKIPHLYNDFKDEYPLYGLGFTYSKLLHSDLHEPNLDIIDLIQNHYFDIIIYGQTVQNQQLLSQKFAIYYDIIMKSYSSHDVIFINGEDHVNHFHLQDFYDKIDIGHYCFIREFCSFNDYSYFHQFIEYFNGIIHEKNMHSILSMIIPNNLGYRNKFIPIYQKYLSHLKNNPNHILELGNSFYSSIPLWFQFFPYSFIYGIFTNHSNHSILSNNRISIFNYQSDIYDSFLKKYQFDIIIISHNDLISIENLFLLLKPNGIMIIENFFQNISFHNSFLENDCLIIFKNY